MGMGTVTTKIDKRPGTWCAAVGQILYASFLEPALNTGRPFGVSSQNVANIIAQNDCKNPASQTKPGDKCPVPATNAPNTSALIPGAKKAQNNGALRQ